MEYKTSGRCTIFDHQNRHISGILSVKGRFDQSNFAIAATAASVRSDMAVLHQLFVFWHFIRSPKNLRKDLVVEKIDAMISRRGTMSGINSYAYKEVRCILASVDPDLYPGNLLRLLTTYCLLSDSLSRIKSILIIQPLLAWLTEPINPLV